MHGCKDYHIPSEHEGFCSLAWTNGNDPGTNTNDPRANGAMIKLNHNSSYFWTNGAVSKLSLLLLPLFINGVAASNTQASGR